MTNLEVNALVTKLAKLPCLGPRSAKVIALHLLNNKDTLIKSLMDALSEVYKVVKTCDLCGGIASGEICDLCSDPKRDESIICVVENIADLWAIEESNAFKGHYHVLNGTLSAVDGRGPEDLRITKLINRVKTGNIKEVILATNATLEGQTTAYYLYDVLSTYEIKISKPAYGIPLGSGFDYLDNGTLEIAFNLRKNFD